MGVAVAERLFRARPLRGRLPAPLRSLAPQGLLLARKARARALARIRPPDAHFRERARLRRQRTRRPAVVQRRARRHRARTPAAGSGERPPRQPAPPRALGARTGPPREGSTKPLGSLDAGLCGRRAPRAGDAPRARPTLPHGRTDPPPVPEFGQSRAIPGSARRGLRRRARSRPRRGKAALRIDAAGSGGVGRQFAGADGDRRDRRPQARTSRLARRPSAASAQPLRLAHAIPADGAGVPRGARTARPVPGVASARRRRAAALPDAATGAAEGGAGGGEGAARLGRGPHDEGGCEFDKTRSDINKCGDLDGKSGRDGPPGHPRNRRKFLHFRDNSLPEIC